MPTGGKLVGAIAFAALAYFISDLVKPLLADTEGNRVGWLSPVNALIGWLMGWKVMGRGAGQKYVQAFGYGLTTMAATAFWCLLFWSGQKMLSRSTQLRYDGPMDALQQMGAMFLDYGRMIMVPEVLVPAIIGALFFGWLTEFFARRWS
ncbi:MAG: TrgA family protein [Silicimonas sp.]|nr:TrgA family protein [Silicimonas sp.]